MSSSGKTTKYGQISEELANRIRSGQLRAGEQFPATRELAEYYHTSILTVRQAIERLVHENLVYTIQGKGVFVSKKKDLPAEEERTIHLVTSSHHENISESQFNGLLLLHLCKEAYVRNMSVTVSMLPRHLSLEDHFRNGIVPSMKHGLILTLHQELTPELRTLFRQERIPLAIIPDRQVDGLPIIRANGEQAWREGLLQLKKLGHQKILILPGMNSLMEVLEISREVGVETSPDYLVPITPWEVESGREAVCLALRRKLDFTAIFCAGDSSTTGVIRELTASGIRIPDDITLLVYDRYPQIASEISCQIAGYQQNFRGMAQALLDLLEAQRKSGTEIVRDTKIPFDFIPGSSCLLNSPTQTKRNI